MWTDSSNTQQHFTYQGADLAIYDAYWDSNSKGWHWQKLSDPNTFPADSPPFSFGYGLQDHICFIDGNHNKIVDLLYDGFGHWTSEEINNPDVGGAFPRFGVFVWTETGFSDGSQFHFTYAHRDGIIWDAFWNVPDNPDPDPNPFR